MPKNSNMRQARIEDSFARQFRAEVREEEREQARRKLSKTRTRWADEGQHETLSFVIVKAADK